MNQNRLDAPPTVARTLVENYIGYRIRQRQLPYGSDLFHDDEANDVQRAIRLLGEELENKYAEFFSSICQTIHLQPNTANSTFTTVVNNLFVPGGINWGRIVSLFVFSAALSMHCIEKEMPFIVEQIVDWTSSYIDAHLSSWIQANGCWGRACWLHCRKHELRMLTAECEGYEINLPSSQNGLVEFSKVRNDNQVMTNGGLLRSACGYALGAIGVLTLGICLSRK